MYVDMCVWIDIYIHTCIQFIYMCVFVYICIITE